MTCLEKIRNMIVLMDTGHTFSARDFLHLCEYNSVRQTLAQLAKVGEIRRIIQGIYDKPAYSDLLQEYSAPSPHDVALALARKHRWMIAPGGEAALNILGLSTQVPAIWQYVSTGPCKTYMIGRQRLEFLHRTYATSPETMMIIEAIRVLGCRQAVEKLGHKLGLEEKRRLAKEAPLWMRSTIRKICGEMPLSRHD